MGRLGTTTGGRLGTQTSNLSTIQGLVDLARKSGFEKEAEKILEQPKLGVLQRLGRILTSFETGNALYQSRYEKKSFAKMYLSDIYGGLKSGITGRETLQTPKRTYKDILVKEGMNDISAKATDDKNNMSDLSEVLTIQVKKSKPKGGWYFISKLLPKGKIEITRPVTYIIFHK